MKIIIVGGGTAGWLAAFLLSRSLPCSTTLAKHNITLIESKKIGIIGVGESTTGALTDIIRNEPNLSQEEFVKFVDATPKYGVKLTNWTNKKSSFYSPITGTPTSTLDQDYLYCESIANKPEDLRHAISISGKRIQTNTNTFGVDDDPHLAYHVNTEKFGEYFKEKCIDKISYIDDKVLDVNLDPNNGEIDSLVLEKNVLLKGDFFIDASGFNRILMKKLNNKWISFEDYLPVNSAIPFLLDIDSSFNYEPVTYATTQNNGWLWQIPTTNRIGCGYVYCDKFVSDDNALHEIQTFLGKKIIPMSKIKFTSGQLQNSWEKNCLAVGLSSFFLEPLQATSIHATIHQIQMFYGFLQQLELISLLEARNKFNEQNNFMCTLLRDFIALHYLGKKQNSDFWKYISNDKKIPEFVNIIVEICKYKVPNYSFFPSINGSAGWSLWSFILSGLNIITPEKAMQELKIFKMQEVAQMIYNQVEEQLNNEHKKYPKFKLNS